MIEVNTEPKVSVIRLGRLQTPIVIIDQAFAQPEALLNIAAQREFMVNGAFFPGVRALAPEPYRRWLLPFISKHCLPAYCSDEQRSLAEARAGLTLCHYSIVTTPAEQLLPEQCVPHVDGCHSLKFAAVHYLFMKPHGGTAFYRHRATEKERITEADHERFFALRQQQLTENTQSPAYIYGDTEHYEYLGEAAGIFNRLVFYPQNLLHSGVIREPFTAPKTLGDARLSINSFITVEL